MEPTQLKLQADLTALLAMAELPASASALLAGVATTLHAIDQLEAEAPEAALRLYSFALPKREAVWWASMCAAGTRPAGQPEAEMKAREAAERWVRQPEEAARRAAMEAARAAGFRAAEAWAAVAAFWSEGSIAPPGQPIVPPPPHLTGTAVHGAVTMAAVRNKPHLRDERLRRFLASARDIAAGGIGRVEADPA